MNLKDYEINEMKKQLEQELNVLKSTIYKITRTETTKEIFDLMLIANRYLSDVCRDKEYILSLEKERNKDK